MRILLTEASSLTARETLTVLGPTGADIHLMSSGGSPICRFSRWSKTIHQAPSPAAGVDYLRALVEVVNTEHIEVVLATHEQAWLAANHPDLLPADFPLVFAPAEVFARVQGKAAFARTCDELRLPQPVWAAVSGQEDLSAVGFPCWLKLEHATAGRGVWHVRSLDEATAVYRLLTQALADDGELELMVQAPAPGHYAQAAGLFDRGRLIALHCSGQLGYGIGGSAAARVSVVHSEAANGLMRLGEALRWTGGLTLDYLHQGGHPQFIECNPRTVEPGNAAAAGVNFPELTIALTRGERLPAKPVFARPGVRTRSTMALMLGMAELTGARRKVAAIGLAAVLRRGRFRASREVLTPVLHDPSSLIPAAAAGLGVLARPKLAGHLAAGAVRSYAAMGADAGTQADQGRPLD